mmetsp:Transcript_8187/g.13138  ORF Transcript_8187/g.13138 Transcript_8187/m.13138 type:complete len:86 (+) Transcript_8187:191-448(+)
MLPTVTRPQKPRRSTTKPTLNTIIDAASIPTLECLYNIMVIIMYASRSQPALLQDSLWRQVNANAVRVWAPANSSNGMLAEKPLP